MVDSTTMTHSRHRTSGWPWHLGALVGITEVCSAILGVVTIGSALDSALGYAFAVALHLLCVVAAWVGARRADSAERINLRRLLVMCGVVLLLLGAWGAVSRSGEFDIGAMLVIGLVAGAGPFTLAILLLRTEEQEPAEGR